MDHILSLSHLFFKGHGHGNDYLIFEEGDSWPVTSKTVEAVCDRWRGVGGDGIVALQSQNGVLRGQDGKDPFCLRMFNPDGSEFERSGNGLRILGSYLFFRGWVKLRTPFPVEVFGDQVEIEILEKEADGSVNVAVEMGEAEFGLKALGGMKGGLEEGRYLPGPAGERLDAQPVSVGNPHCVVFREDLGEEDLLRLGPYLTKHPVFPQGANVQLARSVGEGRVEILIWERGVGRTSSSGTSACATAAAYVHRGFQQPGRIQVVMEGGDFFVTVSPDGHVRLEGPVEPLVWGKLSAALRRRLSASR